ncbi:hypothetical protein [Microvirga lotononidis]|uniref:hypothetical protein n=1 Tax=Microvirga lotononidis TaxID=864069 RepID=UPI000A0657B4|nr:hypothetical protein [Microvirga lotononidis]WQO30996.1 hypothetical protein U0023_27150 [Microvirga lotononidis]
MNPAKDRAWINADTALGHHFCQIAIADPVLAVPAHAQQDDLDWETAALEQRQQGGSSIGRSGLYCRGYRNSAVLTLEGFDPQLQPELQKIAESVVKRANIVRISIDAAMAGTTAE